MAKFSGHETFPFRYGWLTKGSRAVLKNETIFSDKRAMVELGVGKNMVASIRHWCDSAGLLATEDGSPNMKSAYHLTELGNLLFSEGGYDPFLEDPATLWLMHWQIATNRDNCTSWYWLFNYWHAVDFTKEKILSELTKWIEKTGDRITSERSLMRDIDCCFRTYVRSQTTAVAASDDSFDCPLAELELILPLSDKKTYRFNVGDKGSLPNEVFYFALKEFHEKAGFKSTLTLEEVAYAEGSPGKVFKLDDETVARRLEELASAKPESISYSENSGLKQVQLAENNDPLQILNEYFSNQN